MKSSERTGIIYQITDYCASAYGASDTIDALCYGAQFAQSLPLSPRKIQIARHLGGALESVGSSLYIADTLVDGTKFCYSSSRLVQSFYDRKIKAETAFKQFAYDAFTIVADVAEVAKYVLLTIGRVVPNPVKLVASSAWLITDLADLREEFRDLSEKHRGDYQRTYRDLLNLLKVAKTTSGLATDILGVLAIAFICIGSSALVPHLFLAFSVTFLVSNVSIHFFGKSVKLLP
jgi:hypothetical protein